MYPQRHLIKKFIILGKVSLLVNKLLPEFCENGRVIVVLPILKKKSFDIQEEDDDRRDSQKMSPLLLRSPSSLHPVLHHPLARAPH